MRRLVLVILMFTIVACFTGSYASAEVRAEFRAAYLNALSLVDKGSFKGDIEKQFDPVLEQTELEKGYVSLVYALVELRDAQMLKDGSPERALAFERATLNTEMFKLAAIEHDIDNVTSSIVQSILSIASIEQKAALALKEIMEVDYLDGFQMAPQIPQELNTTIAECSQICTAHAKQCDELLSASLATAGEDEAMLDAVVSYPQDIKCSSRLAGECAARALYYLAMFSIISGDSQSVMNEVDRLMKQSEDHLLDSSYSLFFTFQRELAMRADIRLNEKLKNLKVTCSFQEAGLWDVVTFLSDKFGIEMLCEFDAAGEQALTLELKDSTVFDALNLIGQLLNVKWGTSMGMVVFYGADEKMPVPHESFKVKQLSPKEIAAFCSPRNDTLPLWMRKICAQLSQVVSVSYLNTTFAEAMLFLSEKAGVSITFSPEVLDKREIPITFDTKAEAGKILATCCQRASVQYRIEKTGIVFYKLTEVYNNGEK